MTKTTEFIIYLSTLLLSNTRYQNAKKIIHALMEDEHSKYRKLVDGFLISCILISVGAYLYTIKNESHVTIIYLSYVFCIIFAIEYMLRLWVCSDGYKDILDLVNKKNEMGVPPQAWEILIAPLKRKLMWIAQPINIIDLISIFPEFRILRIFKLFRYSDGSRDLFSIFNEKKQEFFVLAILIAVAIFTSSALFYFFEQSNKNVNSFFDAVYWAIITIATVGYGDITPGTMEGKLLATALVFGGLGVIAMLTSLVTTSLTQKLMQIRERKNLESIENSKHFVLVVGFGRMGKNLCKSLKDNNVGFVLIDKNMLRVHEADELGYRTVNADASKPNILISLGVRKKATSIICLANSDIINISIALAARAIGSKANIISKCQNNKYENKMYLAGVNTAIDNSFGAITLAQCINTPVIYQTISSMLFSISRNISMGEICIKYPINIKVIDGMGCVIMGVFRGEKFYFGSELADLELIENDVLIVLGKPLRIEGLKILMNNKVENV